MALPFSWDPPSCSAGGAVCALGPEQRQKSPTSSLEQPAAGLCTLRPTASLKPSPAGLCTLRQDSPKRSRGDIFYVHADPAIRPCSRSNSQNDPCAATPAINFQASTFCSEQLSGNGISVELVCSKLVRGRQSVGCPPPRTTGMTSSFSMRDSTRIGACASCTSSSSLGTLPDFIPQDDGQLSFQSRCSRNESPRMQQKYSIGAIAAPSRDSSASRQNLMTSEVQHRYCQFRDCRDTPRREGSRTGTPSRGQRSLSGVRLNRSSSGSSLAGDILSEIRGSMRKVSVDSSQECMPSLHSKDMRKGAIPPPRCRSSTNKYITGQLSSSDGEGTTSTCDVTPTRARSGSTLQLRSRNSSPAVGAAA